MDWLMLGFLSPRLWLMAAGAIVVSLLSGYLYGCSEGNDRVEEANRKWESQFEQLETEISTERRAAANAFLAFKRAADDAVAEKEKVYEARIADTDARARGALERLRRAAEAGRDRPLQPAAAAPQACSDYEADRTRLPAEDREFLVGEAAAAHQVTERYNLCVAYADEMERYLKSIAAYGEDEAGAGGQR